jgi:thiosulfate dehydrogenase
MEYQSMKGILILTLLSTFFTSCEFQIKEKKPKYKLLNQKLYKEGKSIATKGNSKGALACFSCHTNQGMGSGSIGGYPRLSGQFEGYIEKQLKDYKVGLRVDENDLMSDIASKLSDEEIRAVAYYLNNLPEAEIKLNRKRKRIVANAQSQIERGKSIAHLGLLKKDVPACIKCHGPRGEGIAPHFPRLSGQHFEYLKQRFLSFKEGKNRNDHDGLMTAIAQKLSEKEMIDVLTYFENETVENPIEIDENSYIKAFNQRDLPSGKFGEYVLKGYKTFINTSKMAPEFVGNNNSLSCVNCHLNAGTKLDSAPLGHAFPNYPKYRKKNKKINTFANRLQGCFIYSMNGEKPPADSEVIKHLSAYAYWLAKGLPVGEKTKWSGYQKIQDPPLKPSFERGEVVYKNHCLSCHGSNGQGRYSDNGKTVFPPLWGEGSYNWGAGMHRINTAAQFIKANMPLGKGYLLTDQEAWDVAKYINHHERPQDPRYDGDAQETKSKFHAHHCEYDEI